MVRHDQALAIVHIDEAKSLGDGFEAELGCHTTQDTRHTERAWRQAHGFGGATLCHNARESPCRGYQGRHPTRAAPCHRSESSRCTRSSWTGKPRERRRGGVRVSRSLACRLPPPPGQPGHPPQPALRTCNSSIACDSTIPIWNGPSAFPGTSFITMVPPRARNEGYRGTSAGVDRSRDGEASGGPLRRARGVQRPSARCVDTVANDSHVQRNSAADNAAFVQSFNIKPVDKCTQRVFKTTGGAKKLRNNTLKVTFIASPLHAAWRGDHSCAARVVQQGRLSRTWAPNGCRVCCGQRMPGRGACTLAL